MKKRMVLAAAGCMPLIATAGIMGESLGFADASTPVIVVLGIIALFATRRFLKH